MRNHPYISASGARTKILFLYLGRRGALCQFTLQLAEAASQVARVQPTFVISKTNTLAHELCAHEHPVVTVDTLDSAQPLTLMRNFLQAQRCLQETMARDRPAVVINLLPHVWTPLLAPAVRAAGIPFVTVVHDAFGHPGDRMGLLTWWSRAEIRAADLVVTLSQFVTRQLVDSGMVYAHQIVPLFLPDIVYGDAVKPRKGRPNSPFRLLFFGRILKYKGLPLLIDALEILGRQGIAIDLSVAGAGDIGRERARLSALGATITNRWIEDREIAPLLADCDAVAVPHVECSQSGVVATALGSGTPVVAMPTGGLAEQIVDGVTGILAGQPTAASLASAINRLVHDDALYARICANLRATADERSMQRFLRAILSRVVPRLALRDQPRLHAAPLSELPAFAGQPQPCEVATGFGPGQ